MGRLVVLTTPESATGFRLAGVDALSAPTAADGACRVLDLARAGDGLLAVHESFLAALGPADRRRLEGLAEPMVVALPAGTGAAGSKARRARLTEMLRRAVGYRISFRSVDGGTP